MIEVEVNSIRVSLMNQQRVVILKELANERYLPIWIGQFEAEAITIELQEAEQKRPLTHDLLKNTIAALGGRVVHILINDLRNDIFFARLVIEVGDKTFEVDSRPSDAIALAVRTKSPIFVSESVMAKSAVVPDEDIALDELEGEDNITTYIDSKPEQSKAESLSSDVVDDSKLSAFADFLNSISWDEEDDDKS